MERTLCIIKPDLAAREKAQQLFWFALISSGFLPVQLRRITMTREQATQLYQEHVGQSYFERNVAFVTSAPCVVMVLEGWDVCKRLRKYAGLTDPNMADEDSFRGLFGGELPRNAMHGSASVADAEREIKIFFGEG